MYYIIFVTGSASSVYPSLWPRNVSASAPPEHKSGLPYVYCVARTGDENRGRHVQKTFFCTHAQPPSPTPLYNTHSTHVQYIVTIKKKK